MSHVISPQLMLDLIKTTNEKYPKSFLPLSPKDFFFSCFLKESFLSQKSRQESEAGAIQKYGIDKSVLKHSNDVELSEMYSSLFDFIINKEAEGFPTFYIVHYKSDQVKAFVYNKNTYDGTHLHNGGLIFFGYTSRFSITPFPYNPQQLEYIQKQLDGMVKDGYTTKSLYNMVEYAYNFCFFEYFNEIFGDGDSMIQRFLNTESCQVKKRLQKERNERIDFESEWLSKSKNLVDFNLAITKILRDDLRYLDSRFVDYWSVFYPKFIAYPDSFISQKTIPSAYKRFILYHEIAHFMSGDTGYYLPEVRAKIIELVTKREKKCPYIFLWNVSSTTYLQKKELLIDLTTYGYFEIIREIEESISWIEAIGCFEYLSKVNKVDFLETSKTHPSLFFRYMQCLIYWVEKYYRSFLKKNYTDDDLTKELTSNANEFIEKIVKRVHSDIIHPEKGAIKRAWGLPYDWYLIVVIYVIKASLLNEFEGVLFDRMMKPDFHVGGNGWLPQKG